ncbi:MAG: hypothetical protein KA337_06420, partial [Ferruginibacter sp.]|nr:hypothetical protein [Ferruginibacter sp.]
LGVPHAQSEAIPPLTHPPLFASKPSMYGNADIGVVHWLYAFAAIHNKNIVTRYFIKAVAF